MSPQEEQRFTALQGRFVDPGYVNDYYGIHNLPQNKLLCDDLAGYRAAFRHGPNPPQGMIDRYLLESFLQDRNLLPKKWLAARLGMNEGLLDVIIQRRADLPTPLRREYVEYSCLVDVSFVEDLQRSLPGLRFRTFYDFESFCQRLHAELRQQLQLTAQEIENGALWCATDRELANLGEGDYPRRYAQHFDCITTAPLSVAHQIWLDFGKPLSLPPDRCSKLFFVRNEAELAPFSAGRRPAEGLERYQQVLQGAP